jgi:hypothetical protein
MQASFSAFAAGFCFAVSFVSPAAARPATDADLAGKKFCWNDGGAETYYPGGKYSSTHDGEGTWVVTPRGVQISTNQITGLADIQRLADGTFTATWIVDGKPKTWTGHYCP